MRQLGSRSLNVASALVCSILIARVYGATDLANYVYAISFLNIFAAISLLGFEISIMEAIRNKAFSSIELAGSTLFVAFIVLVTVVVQLASDHFIGTALFSLELSICLAFTSIAYLLSNIYKYYNLWIFELVRGGGLNSIFCVLLIMNIHYAPNHYRLESLLVVCSATLLALSIAATAKYRYRLTNHQSNGLIKHLTKSTTLAMTAIFSGIMVTGEIIIARQLLNEFQFSILAILSRLSFAFGVIFIILNNNHSVNIARNNVQLPRPWEVLRKNAPIAAFAFVTAVTLHQHYISLFAPEFVTKEFRLAIYFLITAHSINILSAGAIPFLVISSPKAVRTATLFGLALMLGCVTYTQATTLDKLLAFCVTFYGTLIIYKVVLLIRLVTFSERTDIRS